MAAGDLSLIELCRICNANPPKYKCPRCAVQTCSLTCSKRHKLWSQCSGVRDPAAYRRKHELATPTAIDQDYNYLVGLERHLDSVDRRMDERGIAVDAQTQTSQTRSFARRRQPQKGEVNVQQAIEKCGVIVERAPQGMQRQKNNGTHWHKKRKCLMWTVEWRKGAESPPSRLGLISEMTPLNEAYEAHLECEQRSLSKNRKLEDEDSDPHVSAPGPSQSGDAPSTSTTSPTEPTSGPTPSTTTISPPNPGPEFTASQQQHFYLHRVHSPSRSTVLIPLSATATLADVLRDNVILEFPTIYVLPYDSKRLPTGFQTEDDFLRGGSGYSPSSSILGDGAVAAAASTTKEPTDAST